MAQNKGSSSSINDTSKMDREWKELSKKFKESNKAFKEAMQEIGQNFNKKEDTVSEIRKAIENDSNGIKEDTPKFIQWLFGDKNQYAEALENYKKMLKDRKDIEEMYADDPEKQKTALALYGQARSRKGNNIMPDDDGGVLGDVIGGMKDELTDGLAILLTDFDHFGDNLDKIGKKICQKMIKQMAEALIQVIINEQSAAMAIQSIRALWDFGGAALGWAGKGVKAFGGFLGGIFHHHSGGVIPSSSHGYSLPGTDEQLALLKGGERVLSPGENVEYERGNNGGQPVVFNNFNVKAWDSKDVSKYLLENKNLLNAITYDGIKCNNQMLRQIVRNA